MKPFISLVFTCLILTNLSYSQTGKHGSKTVSGREIHNEYTDLTTDANSGDVTISVTNSDLNDNGRFVQTLQVGDLLMLIQIQGASLKGLSQTDSSWGEITNYNNSGNSEYIEVASVPNGTTIALTCALINNYTATGKVVVVRVPRYSTLTLQSGDTISGDPWNGTIGGVVAIEVDGNATINGVIEMNGKGFRGTTSTTGQGSKPGARNEFASSSPNAAGLKGEGIAGYHLEYDALLGKYGQGAPANGGGGGCSTDAGGGGGANAGDVAKYSGHGVPSLSNPAWAAAWELEVVGFSTKVSSGGGRGGYSRCGAGLDPLTSPPDDYGTWKGDGRRPSAVGLGGRPLDYSTGKIFLGGGGGQGHGSDRDASAGASGGGLVSLKVSGDIIGGGSIEANGSIGESNQNASGFSSAIDGGGGGGAGGTVIVNSKGTISLVNIIAVGGEGGSVSQTSFANPSEANGPGGGGSGGYVNVSSAGAIINISGGSNGEMISTYMANFPPNGATGGGEGVSEITPNSTPSLTLTHDTICVGETANLLAVGNNLPNGAIITWYDAFSNGNVIGTGTSYSDAGITTDTMFFIEVCPGNLKDTLFVKIDTPPNASVVNDTVNGCANNDVQIEALGGTNYTWWQSAGLSATNISNPIANVSASQMYYVEVSSVGGCSDTDSVYVNISANLVVNLGTDFSICKGDTASLSATGGSTYTWTPTNSIVALGLATVEVIPTDTTTYYITVDDGSGCTGTDSVTVNVLPEIRVVSPGNQDLCKDDLVNLVLSHTGGSGGSVTYSWDDGVYTGAVQNLSWSASTNMEVKATDDTYGCSDSITMIVNIRDFDLDFTYTDTCFNSTTSFSSIVTSNGTIANYDWDFSNSNTGTGATESYQFTQSGSSIVKLFVTDDLGCVDSVEKTISIQPLPNTTIVMAPDTICVNDFITYSNNYNGVAGSTFDWSFGDGGTETNGTGNHTYTTTGYYLVTLEVTDINGCSKLAEDSVYVGAGPVANFTIPTQGQIGETVDLTNISTDGQIYAWVSGNTFLSSDFSTTLDLDSTGVKCVTLGVLSQAGCEDTISHCITVIGQEVELTNIFTPNNDGDNETFELLNLEGRTVDITVYNRWGVEVFEAKDYQNDWAGLDKKGNNLADGTYFYAVTDVTGETPKQFNGFVVIAR